MARAPCSRAVAMRVLIALRSRPSRVAAGSPARSERHRERHAEDVPVGRDDGDGEVAGVDVDRHDRVRPQLVQRRDRAGAAVFHDASRYQRPDAGSSAMSYRTAPVAAWAATSSPR